MPLHSQRFNADHHDVADFDCGEHSLNAWLQDHAVNEARRTARTWVWVDDDSTVVGYYALAAHKVARADVPSRIGRGGPVEIPAVLLAKLALDQRVQGKNLGPVLVADALGRVVDATRIVTARLVVVDALHEKVAQFYERLGFKRVPNSLLLVLEVSDAEAAAEQDLNPAQ